MIETLEQRETLYKSIAKVIDNSTKRILYIQFVNKYYPEVEEAILDGLKEQFSGGI